MRANATIQPFARVGNCKKSIYRRGHRTRSVARARYAECRNEQCGAAARLRDQVTNNVRPTIEVLACCIARDPFSSCRVRDKRDNSVWARAPAKIERRNMLRSCCFSVALLAATLTTTSSYAQSTGSGYLDTILRRGSIPSATNPSSGYVGGYPAVGPQCGYGGFAYGGFAYGGFGYGGFGYGYPYGPYGYPYYLDAGEPYPFGPYVLPPAYMPAENMYGPQALNRFLGVNPARRRNDTVIVVPPNDVDDNPGANVRVSNAESRARAGRFMDIGDNYFAEQKYHSASQRYKSATEAAPDLAEAYLRQGHALVAMRQYEAAAQVYRRAVRLDPQVVFAPHSLADLYGGANVAKAAHQEALAQAATDQPDSPDLLFALGVHLHFDGESDRAIPFFRRAFDLIPLGERDHVEAFLPRNEGRRAAQRDEVEL